MQTIVRVWMAYRKPFNRVTSKSSLFLLLSFSLRGLFGILLSLSFLTSLNSVARSEVAIAEEGWIRRVSSSSCDFFEDIFDLSRSPMSLISLLYLAESTCRTDQVSY